MPPSVRLPGFLRRIRLQQAMVVLCLSLVVAYGASSAGALFRSYRQALEDASATLESIARSTQAGTNRSIFEVDATLLGVERTLAALEPDAPLDSRAVKTVLRQFNDQTLVVRDIQLFDLNGRLVNSASSAAQAKRDYADAPFFKAHRSADQPTLFIGRPEHSAATGGWSVMMSRPLMRGDNVIGVIAAEVPTAVFTDYFDAVVAKSGVRVSLLADDGTLIASEPHLEDQIGRRPVYADRLLAAAAKSRLGVIARSQSFDGSPSIRAFGWVPARPLLISASRTHAEILTRWYGECVTTAIGFVVFAVTAGCLTGLMVRALNRQQRATAELQTSEERLKQQSTLLQNTLENMGEGLSVFDNDGRLVAWNSRFVELLDLPDTLAAGTTTLYEILRLQMARGDFGQTEVTDEAVRQRIASFYRNLPTVRERVMSSGRVLQIRRRSMPSGVVSLYSDITERKQAEATMAHAWAQAELANRAKSEFLANMSHELRTPLNAIIGFSEILSGEHLGAMSNPRYLEYSHDIHSSGLHLLSIINDVLDMSKIEAGKLEIHEDEVAVGPLLASVARMVAERARETQVALVVEPPEEGLRIWADERAMKQCLLNLLSNAVKFSDAGGTVSAAATVEGDGSAVFTIADTGIGMSPEDMERALQPFGQAKAATTRAYGGTGLGLPITKGLVEAHGGRLEIDSRLGQGTRIRIVFPPERTRAAGLLPEPAHADIA